eukprot:scaffold206130_cov38-Prasinocladus_malaysianus.AAC.1
MGLWAAIGVILALLVTFLIFAATYLKTRRKFARVAAEQVYDLASPVNKAADLLKELSSSIFLSKATKSRVNEVAMKLLGTENLHAPDLAAQTNSGNRDLFASITGQPGSASSGFAEPSNHTGVAGTLSLHGTRRSVSDINTISSNDMPVFDQPELDGA